MNREYWPKINMPSREKRRYFKGLIREGLNNRYSIVSSEIENRAMREYKEIIKQRYIDYFLIIHDIVRFANKAGIAIGQGRGSSAGSIICYALGITGVDPMKHGLIYELFLNNNAAINIGIDFDFNRRDEVCEYIKHKYGADCAAKSSWYFTYSPKSAIREKTKQLGLSYEKAETIINIMHFAKIDNCGLKGFIGKENTDYIIPKLKSLYEKDNEVKKIIDASITIEGSKGKSKAEVSSIVVLSNKPIKNIVPISHISQDGWLVTEYDASSCENIGLLKINLLGLRDLHDIQKTVKTVRMLQHDFDINSIDYSDYKVLNFIGGVKWQKSAEYDDNMNYNRLLGVFKLESKEIQHFLSLFKPNTFADIVIAMALNRINSKNIADKVIEGKENPKTINYLHKMIMPILAGTYGVVLYQEQIINILSKVAGFNLIKANIARTILKENEQAQVIKVRANFIKGAIKNGIHKETAIDIFSKLVQESNSVVCKAHYVSYAKIAFQTAYLSFYYPKEFYSACIETRAHSCYESDKFKNHLKILKKEEQNGLDR